MPAMPATGSVGRSATPLAEDCSAELVELAVRGMHRGPVTPQLETLAEQGLAVIKGALAMPTPQGTELAGEMLRLPSGSAEERRVRALYEAFLPINRRLRDVCTTWQCRPDGSANDHSDAAYDAAVRDDLDDVHEAVAPVLRRLAPVLPRIGGYLTRLEAALERLDDGDHSWMASPMVDSYHTVWMHLHQELLLALGVSRAEDAELEERLVAETRDAG
ncbi:MarR family transcriptional regulator [Actinomadura sp. 6N118]|uniref:MarR family transcriptional regulator n=1 Tax=Actinomadura sp. 6N118 TaxID=3375151 RepID=UPI003794EE83